MAHCKTVMTVDYKTGTGLMIHCKIGKAVMMARYKTVMVVMMDHHKIEMAVMVVMMVHYKIEKTGKVVLMFH